MSSVSRYFFLSPCMLSLHPFFDRPLPSSQKPLVLAISHGCGCVLASTSGQTTLVFCFLGKFQQDFMCASFLMSSFLMWSNLAFPLGHLKKTTTNNWYRSITNHHLNCVTTPSSVAQRRSHYQSRLCLKLLGRVDCVALHDSSLFSPNVTYLIHTTACLRDYASLYWRYLWICCEMYFY